MSGDTPVLPPPQGNRFDSLLDRLLDFARPPVLWPELWEETRAELAALRKELATTQGLLATARENLVAMDAQRAEAVRERDAHHDVEAALDRALQERDALRAQVAELRGAILGLGEVRGHLFIDSDGARYLTVHFEDDKFGAIESLNALVFRLSAEALPGAGEPAAGEGAGR